MKLCLLILCLLNSLTCFAEEASSKTEVQGYKLIEVQSGSMFQQLGLQRGDVIKKVDGKPVTSPQEAMAIYDIKKKAKKMKIEIERNGKTEILKYEIK